MATIQKILEALSTQEEAVSMTALAKQLKASKEGTLKQLTREKEKGNVEGNSEEGWLITEAGKALVARGVFQASMIDEGVTPRQQFEAIARRIGIYEDRIQIATDIVWSGDFEDIQWVWEALRQSDIALDLRNVWVNSWRAKLHKAIPASLEGELTAAIPGGVAEGGEGVSMKRVGRDYIIVDEEVVRVGENLGDFSLKDAKDLLGLRVLRNRFAGNGQRGTGQPPASTDKVTEVINALEPYINKGSDIAVIKEVIENKLELQKQDILRQIPRGPTAQPMSFVEQITGLVTGLSSLKEVGPILRSILGVPEPGSASDNPSGTPVSITGVDGKPLVMDLGRVIDWKRFESGERREEERHSAVMGLAQVVRENFSDGVAALKAAAEEGKKSTASKESPPEQEQQTYRCACGTEFVLPQQEFKQIKCPNPVCGKLYTKAEIEGAT